MSNKRILVTGGAGFVGSHLVDALLKRGHQVRVFDNLTLQVHGDGMPAYFPRDVEFVHGDVRQYDRLRDAVRNRGRTAPAVAAVLAAVAGTVAVATYAASKTIVDEQAARAAVTEVTDT